MRLPPITPALEALVPRSRNTPAPSLDARFTHSSSGPGWLIIIVDGPHWALNAGARAGIRSPSASRLFQRTVGNRSWVRVSTLANSRLRVARAQSYWVPLCMLHEQTTTVFHLCPFCDIPVSLGRPRQPLPASFRLAAPDSCSSRLPGPYGQAGQPWRAMQAVRPTRSGARPPDKCARPVSRAGWW